MMGVMYDGLLRLGERLPTCFAMRIQKYVNEKAPIG